MSTPAGPVTRRAKLPKVPVRSSRPGSGSGRAAPLPPEERRAAIITSALPLISEYGPNVTTRQIAEAAGIAEGTIFRVFPDKDALIRAAVDTAFDPAPALVRIAAIDPDLPLRQRMEQVVEIIRGRLSDVWRLLSALRMYSPPQAHRDHRHLPPFLQHSDLLATGIEAVLAPSAAEFRVDPGYVARVLRLLVFGATNPRITDENPLTNEEIVSILLDGLRAHSP